jgi:hypothetical protein
MKEDVEFPTLLNLPFYNALEEAEKTHEISEHSDALTPLKTSPGIQPNIGDLRFSWRC